LHYVVDTRDPKSNFIIKRCKLRETEVEGPRFFDFINYNTTSMSSDKILMLLIY